MDPVLQFETQLKIIKSSFKMAFSVTNLDEVREIRMNEDDEDDLEVRLASFNRDETSLCTAIPQDVCPQVVIYVFLFTLFRYNRQIAYSSTNIFSWTPSELYSPWGIRNCIEFIGTNGQRDFD